MSLVERRIREAMDRGEFDNLPGAGKPIPDLDVDYDPAWWVRKWVQRERLTDRVRELRELRGEELLRLRAGALKTVRGREAARRRIDRLDSEIAEVDRRLAGLGREGSGPEGDRPQPDGPPSGSIG
jgi:hypothetical protein